MKLTKHKLSLHAPAGDMDSVKAAVYNGADAVYLGIKLFNARRLAKNFSFEELKDIIFFAHIHNVKIYLTMNTLVRNEEIIHWFKTLEHAYFLGIDGVIIQEIFFAPLIKSFFPGITIHASTQASFMNYHSINFFKDFDIVVLARELTHDQIKDIKKHTSTKLEMFVHGHMCISYSGQCLISSLIGKRSGNRGVCASSCRKQYDAENTRSYLISAKDLFLANKIDTINELGISAIKIEGRMKSAEYVGTTTKAYRKQIDSLPHVKPLQADEFNNIKIEFNRDFTTGFFDNNTSIVGKEMPMNRGIYLGTVHHKKLRIQGDLNLKDGISFWHPKNNGKLTGTIVTKIMMHNRNIEHAKKGMEISIPSKEFIDNTQVFLTSKNIINHKNENYKKKFPIAITGIINQPLFFHYNGISVSSDIPLVKAEKNSLQQEQIIKELGKSERIGIFWKTTIYSVEDNLFLPISVLRKLREKLEQKISEQITPNPISNFDPIHVFNNTASPTKNVSAENTAKAFFIVKVYNIQQLKEAEEAGADIIYYDVFNYNLKEAQKICKNSKFFLDTPVVISDDDIFKIEAIINDIKPDGIVIGNWGLLGIVFKGIKHGKYSLNTFNDVSAAELRKLDILPMLSIELNAKQVLNFKNKEFIYYCHGRIPVMHFKGEYSEKKLTDEKGYTFPLRIINNNTEMLYSRPIALFEKIKPLFEGGVTYFMLDLEKDVTTILQTYKNILSDKKLDISMLKKGTTIGNYLKGVA